MNNHIQSLPNGDFKVLSHIEALERKHKELDERIAKDKDPEYILSVLKREKLQLKDEILREKTKYANNLPT